MQHNEQNEKLRCAAYKTCEFHNNDSDMVVTYEITNNLRVLYKEMKENTNRLSNDFQENTKKK